MLKSESTYYICIMYPRCSTSIIMKFIKFIKYYIPTSVSNFEHIKTSKVSIWSFQFGTYHCHPDISVYLSTNITLVCWYVPLMYCFVLIGCRIDGHIDIIRWICDQEKIYIVTSFFVAKQLCFRWCFDSRKGAICLLVIFTTRKFKNTSLFFSLLSIYFINHSLGISYKQDIWMHSGQEQRDDSDL